MKEISTRLLVKISLTVIAIFLVIHYWTGIAGFLGVLVSACVPLLLGLCLAYVLNILMSFYERHFFPNSRHRVLTKLRPGLCLLFAFLTLLAVLVLIWRLVIPQLTQCLMLLLTQVPVALERLADWLAEQGILTEDFVNGVAAWIGSLDWQARMGEILSTAFSGVGSVLSSLFGTVAAVFSGVTTLIFTVTFAVFVLLGKRRLASQGKRLMGRYLKEKYRNRLTYFLSTLNDCFHRFIVGQCTEAVILGTLCALGMTLLRLPYALMIGVLTAFTALIPILGAYIGGGIGALLILTESPTQALIFLVFIIVLQQLEGDLIYPHVVGSSIQLPGIWVFVAVTIGGGVFGIIGMLAGVPLAACCYRLIRNDVNGVRISSSTDV